MFFMTELVRINTWLIRSSTSSEKLAITSAKFQAMTSSSPIIQYRRCINSVFVYYFLLALKGGLFLAGGAFCAVCLLRKNFANLEE